MPLKIMKFAVNSKKTRSRVLKMAYPALGNPLEGIPNVSRSRCYQNLSNTVYRIKTRLTLPLMLIEGYFLFLHFCLNIQSVKV